MDFKLTELMLHAIKREEAIIRRGSDKGYNIVFYGIGNIAKTGLDAICNANPTMFDLPIDKIFLVGNDKPGSTERRERYANEARVQLRNNSGCNAQVITSSVEELPDILPATDLFMFTADSNNPGETNRIALTYKNVSIVEKIAKYFTPEFKGIINFVSNIPEVLAHYAASNFRINDPRQITAHIPLDLIRYQYLIHDKVLRGRQVYGLDLVVVGYHDHPYPVINRSKVCRAIMFNPSETREVIQDITSEILNTENIGSIISTLELFGYNQMLLLKKQIQAIQDNNPTKEIFLQDSPTSSTTGRAIRDFVRAVINRDKTATAIPYNHHGRWFFVDLPVTFERGYPIIDEARFERLDEKDHNQLSERILLLEDVVDNVLGKSVNFRVPESTAKIDAILNPRGTIRRTEHSTIEIKSADDTELSGAITSLKSQIESIKTHIGAERVSNGERRKYEDKISALTSDVRELEGEKKRKEALSSDMLASLDGKLYLPNQSRKLVLSKYSFNHSLKPSIKEFELTMKGTLKPREAAEENSCMEIDDFCTDGRNVYVLARRKHTTSMSEYRIFMFDEATGDMLHISPKLGTGDDLAFGYELVDMKMHGGSPTMIKKEKRGSFVCSYNPKTKSLSIQKKIEENADAILPFMRDFIVLSQNSFYMNGRKIHSSNSDLSGFLHVAERNNILFYDTESSLHGFEIGGRRQETLSSQWCINDVVELRNSGMQIITGVKGKGIEVSYYENSAAFFDNHAATYMIEDEKLSKLSRIFAANPNLILGLRNPDYFVAIYHDKTDYLIKEIGITHFNAYGGKMVRHGI